MTTYVLILASALVLAVGVTPLVQRLARRTGMVDKPSARKQHTVPTPLLGGLAIYLAVIVALVILGDRFYVSQVISIFVGATLMSFLGLWDDRRGLSPWVKLGGPVPRGRHRRPDRCAYRAVSLGVAEHRGDARCGSSASPTR